MGDAGKASCVLSGSHQGRASLLKPRLKSTCDREESSAERKKSFKEKKEVSIEWESSEVQR